MARLGHGLGDGADGCVSDDNRSRQGLALVALIVVAVLVVVVLAAMPIGPSNDPVFLSPRRDICTQSRGGKGK